MNDVKQLAQDLESMGFTVESRLGTGSAAIPPADNWRCTECGTRSNKHDPRCRYATPIPESVLKSATPTVDAPAPHPDVFEHPLYAIFVAAIEQAMYGKGERHGGARTPFLEQPWAHYVNMHGRGFATGQAAKKLEEAASTREGTPFETEIFGAMVYLGMAVLKERGEV